MRCFCNPLMTHSGITTADLLVGATGLKTGFAVTPALGPAVAFPGSGGLAIPMGIGLGMTFAAGRDGPPVELKPGNGGLTIL